MPSALKPFGRRKPAEVRLDGADYIWAISCAAVAAAFALFANHLISRETAGHHTALRIVVGCAIMAAISALAYLAGRFVKDRATAVAAGLLAATCVLATLGAMNQPLRSIAAVAVGVSLIFAARGRLAIATALAIVAACFDLSSIGLAISLVTLGAVRRDKELGAAAVIVVAGLIVIVALCRLTHMPLPHFSLRAHWSAFAPVGYAVGCAALFFVPWVTDLSGRETWEKWHPHLLAALIMMLLIFSTARPGTGDYQPLLIMLWIALGAGISRIMPSAVGDLPTPAARYLVASIGIILVLIIRFSTELGPVLH